MKFTFDLTFELIIDGKKENQLESIKNSNFKCLKIDKDMCDCEFIAFDKNVYAKWQQKLSEIIT